MWVPGTVVKKTTERRYTISRNGRLYERNTEFIKIRKEDRVALPEENDPIGYPGIVPIASPNEKLGDEDARSEDETELMPEAPKMTRSGRVVRPNSRFQDFILGSP